MCGCFDRILVYIMRWRMHSYSYEPLIVNDFELSDTTYYDFSHLDF